MQQDMVPIVDTHCHAGKNWYEPIESLLHQMDTNGVDKAVLIQHRGSFDNSYLFECASRFRGRFAVIALVDSSQSDALDRISEIARNGATGIRLTPKEPLSLWEKAEQLNLVVSCQGNIKEFSSEEFREKIAHLSNLKIVIEHLAGADGHELAPYPQFSKALRLSELPNTYIKIPGLGEFSQKQPVLGSNFGFDTIPPFIEMTTQAFGPSRMMWGSDFPPVSSREGYRNAKNAIETHPVLKFDRNREWIMGKAAIGVFNFDP